MDSYITTGELAKLAGTTKRTILFYDEKDVLKPAKVNSKGYRFYKEEQVLDYQKILLLTTLGISLDEIRLHLRTKGSLAQLFDQKRPEIKKEISRLKFNLSSLEKFSKNMNINGTMVKPEIKVMKPFLIYYVDKVGAYAKICNYCQELEDMFDRKGKDFTTLAIFEEPDYQPKRCKMKIGVLAKQGMKVGEKYKGVVKQMTFSPGKVITHGHNGSGTLLSLFWKELEKYCQWQNIKIRKDIPDFEIYRRVNSDPSKQFFEIYLPIR